MTIIQYLSAFRLFGADALILALGVTVFTSLLKKTVLRALPKRFFVFLPFVLGVIAYAGFRMLATLSVAPLTQGLAETFEGGFAVGCAATLYYVLYEQFLRGKEDGREKISPLGPLLGEYIPKEELSEAEKALLSGADGLKEEELVSFVQEILVRYARETSPAELALLARLVARYLKTVKG